MPRKSNSKPKHTVNPNRAYVIATTRHVSAWPHDSVVRSSALYIPGQALIDYNKHNYISYITFEKELLKKADKAVKNGIGYIPENEFEMYAIAEIPLTEDMLNIARAQRTIDKKGKTLAKRLLKKFPLESKTIYEVKGDD